MNIPELIKESHDNAVERGFYDCPTCTDGYQRNPKWEPGDSGHYEWTCTTCEGTSINKDKNIGELLMLIVSELGEALEAHRCGQSADWTDYEKVLSIDINVAEKHKNLALNIVFKNDIKDTFEDEIADVFIRLFDLCAYLEEELNDECRMIIDDNFNIGDILLTATSYICDFQNDNNDTSMLQFFYDVIMSLCKKLNIPIEKHIRAKMAYNRTRPRKHNKEY